MKCSCCSLGVQSKIWCYKMKKTEKDPTVSPQMSLQVLANIFSMRPADIPEVWYKHNKNKTCFGGNNNLKPLKEEGFLKKKQNKKKLILLNSIGR